MVIWSYASVTTHISCDAEAEVMLAFSVDSIVYSNYDVDKKYYEEIVSPDSTFIIPLAIVDNVG